LTRSGFDFDERASSARIYPNATVAVGTMTRDSLIGKSLCY
jgi:hypothetical protein